MTMQRRHFELIAETLREHTFAHNKERDAELRERMALRFVSNLVLTNPNFNCARFLRACGVADD